MWPRVRITGLNLGARLFYSKRADTESTEAGGTVICSTPNFRRLRNVLYLALGLGIYDYCRMLEDTSLEHVIEYSRDHLQWQFEKP
jgi:hypothetical protein